MLKRPLVAILLGLITGIIAAPVFTHKPIVLAIVILGLFGIGAIHLTHTSNHAEKLLLVISFMAVGILITNHESPDPTLQAILNSHKRVKFEGTVLDSNWIQEGKGRFNVMVEWVYLPTGSKPVTWKARLTVYQNVPRLVAGQRILFSCIPKAFHNFYNPGCFDYEKYMKHKGFAFSAPISDGRRIVSLGKGALPWPRGLVEHLRAPVRAFYTRQLRGDELALYCAIVLGERELISPQLREKFSRAGLSHILAVSGLHMGIVAWLAFVGIRKVLSLSPRLILVANVKKLSSLFTSVPILIYLTLSGYQVSATRAAIMALAYLWSIVLDKEKEIWSTLCLSAIIVLSIQPFALYHISFQLSYLAVIGLIWLCPKMFGILTPLLDTGLKHVPLLVKRLSQYLGSLAIITFTALLFLMPVVLYYFHRISLVAFPANFIVVPILGFVVIPCGLLSSLLLPVVPFLAKTILLIGSLGLHGILWAVDLFASMSISSIWLVTPSWLEIALFYAALLIAFSWGKGKWVKIGLVCIFIVAIADVSYWIVRTKFNDDLRISFLDVGHGNCALVELPGGKKILIDGGGFATTSFDVGKMVVAPYLWSQKISKIDYLVLTHPQSDHMNGLIFIAKVFDPQVFYYNGQETHELRFVELMQALKRNHVKIMVPTYPREKIELQGARLTMFRLRPRDFASRSDATLNNCSMVLRLAYKKFAALFPGDIERPAEAILVSSQGPRLQSQVLLCPHHGSDTSCSSAFLYAVKPRLCVISCRESKRLGLPSKKTIERLRRLNCAVLRTDKDGMVQVVVQKAKLRVRTFLSHLNITYSLTSRQSMGKNLLS